MKTLFLVVSASLLLMVTGCATNTGTTKSKPSVLNYENNGNQIEIKLKAQPYSDRSLRMAVRS